MGKVLKSVISVNQIAFLEERNILDGVVLNEIIEYAKKGGKSLMFFKADFEKAYDSVSWEFIDHMLVRLGFCTKWRAWIGACLHSASVSVLVDESPSREFSMSRGIR